MWSFWTSVLTCSASKNKTHHGEDRLQIPSFDYPDNRYHDDGNCDKKGNRNELLGPQT